MNQSINQSYDLKFTMENNENHSTSVISVMYISLYISVSTV